MSGDGRVQRLTLIKSAIFIIVLVLAGLQVAAFRWGVVTPDTIDQFQQALTGQYDDWHPPVTAWLWRMIMKVSGTPEGILIFDVGCYWLGIILFAAAMLRHRERLAAVLMVGIGMFPIFFGQMGAMLKDPLLTALCLAGAGFLFCTKRPAIAVPFLVVATATRFNALFATAPLMLGLFPGFAFQNWRRMIVIVAISAAALIATTWAINVVLLKPHKSEPIFSLVNFDLAGIAAHGGGNPYPSMADAETRRLTAQCYDARLYNPANSDECNSVEDRLMSYAHAHHASAVGIWIGAVSRNPIPYLQHRLQHLNWNWRFIVPHVPADAVYMMSEPNDLGLAFTPNALTKWVVSAAQFVAWTPLGRPATWLAVALALLILSRGLPSRLPIEALALSSLAYGGAYTAVSVAPDMRYNLWTMMAPMLAGVLAFADMRAGAQPGRRNIWAASVLVTIVIAAEILALAAG